MVFARFPLPTLPKVGTFAEWGFHDSMGDRIVGGSNDGTLEGSAEPGGCPGAAACWPERAAGPDQGDDRLGAGGSPAQAAALGSGGAGLSCRGVAAGLAAAAMVQPV